jgi:hypothetical protein
VTEVCQFLGGYLKVVITVYQLPWPPYTVCSRGGGLILSYEKTSQLMWKILLKGQKGGFFLNEKIPDCEPTSAAGELKKR